MILAIVLLSFLALWGVADYLAFKLNRETMSQWVIKITKKNKFLRYLVLFILFFTAIILAIHWELI